MNDAIEDMGKDFAEDALKQAGREVLDDALKAAEKDVENVAENLLKKTDINNSMLNNLGFESAENINKDELQQAMSNIIRTDGPEVAEDVAGLAAEESEAAQNALANDINRSAPEAEQKAAAERILSDKKYNFGKLSGTIMKYTGFAAIAIMMLKGFLRKNGTKYNVKQITVADSIITFTISDGDSFTPGDSFTFSGFSNDSTGVNQFLNLNDNVVTLTESCGPATIKIKTSDLVLTPQIVSSKANGKAADYIFGYMTCSADLEGNLFHSTGEVLGDLTKLADGVVKTAADDLGITGFLGSFLGSFKWIIIVSAIIFALILLFWIYKQFKGGKE